MSNQHSLKCISWNIHGGFSEKIKDLNFKHFISSYDIVLLTECWIDNDYELTIEGYECFVFAVKRRKSFQGGGTVIMCKTKFIPFISVVENCCDSIIWLKIDKRLSKRNRDIFIACVYIPG